MAVANTAVAAQMVASSGRRDVAAISSRSCMELYGLQNLASSIQDKGNNRTRFICISKNMEIYPGADKTSIMMVLNHKPGALYKVLARIYALGINVTKLESRPIPERDRTTTFAPASRSTAWAVLEAPPLPQTRTFFPAAGMPLAFSMV